MWVKCGRKYATQDFRLCSNSIWLHGNVASSSEIMAPCPFSSSIFMFFSLYSVFADPLSRVLMMPMLEAVDPTPISALALPGFGLLLCLAAYQPRFFFSFLFLVPLYRKVKCAFCVSCLSTLTIGDGDMINLVVR